MSQAELVQIGALVAHLPLRLQPLGRIGLRVLG
jgi:hypothetical protein